MKRESFVFYRSYKNALNALPTENQLTILNAIIDYALDGIEPQISGIELAFFELVRPQINANNVKYENGCKGAEYGKLGGAPKGNQNAKKNPKTTPKQPQDNPKTTRNENANANDNENDNDNENAASNARVREEGNETAKKEFFKEFPHVSMNGANDSSVDYAKLLTAFREGNDFLKNTRSMNYIVTHYSEIIGGEYKRAADKQSAPQKKSGLQYWQELIAAVGKAKEKRHCEYMNADVSLYALATSNLYGTEDNRSEASGIYNALSEEVKNIYDCKSFYDICGMEDNELKFERARFIKEFA